MDHGHAGLSDGMGWARVSAAFVKGWEMPMGGCEVIDLIEFFVMRMEESKRGKERRGGSVCR